MSKLILLIVIFAGAWWLIRRYVRSMRNDAVKPAAAPEDMVRCARCGVHLPRSESVMRETKLFCSQEHAQQGD